LSNDAQSVTQTTTFDAFGNVESSAGGSNNVYRYAGQHGYRNDGDDGLMHVGARYYDPLVGRFISADTYLGEVGNPQSLNRYGYVENNPVNAVDPTGHIPQWLENAWNWLKDTWYGRSVGTTTVTVILYYLYALWRSNQELNKAIELREQTTGKSTSGLSPLDIKRMKRAGLDPEE
jgi:RHS repeat-associated protein